MQKNNMMSKSQNLMNMNNMIANQGINNMNQNQNMMMNVQNSVGPFFNQNNIQNSNMNFNNNMPFMNNNNPRQKQYNNLNNDMNNNLNNKIMNNNPNNNIYPSNFNNHNNQINNIMKNQMNNQNNQMNIPNNQMNNQNNQMNNMNNKNFGNNNINNYNNNQNNNNMSNFSINTNFLNNNNNINKQQNMNLYNNNLQILENKLMSIFNTNFSDNKFINLQTAPQILLYFSFGEKQCLNFINSNMINKYMYAEHIFQLLSQKFNNSPNLNHNITSQIISILNSAPLGTFTSRQEYFNYLTNNFGNVEMPQFLIKKDLECLDKYIQYLNRSNKTTTIISNMKNMDGNSSSNLVIDFYVKMKNNQMQLFQGINKRYELFCLFLCINKSLFFKRYIDNQFICFLEWNIDLIRMYFGNNINYVGIVNYLKQLNNPQMGGNNNYQNQEDIIFNNIALTLNNNINIISNIISSFYILLFYKFKNLNKTDAKCNMDNTHLTVALKKFVIYLNEKCPLYANNGNNLFQLLMGLINYDVDNLKTSYNFFPKKNKSYSFYDIDYILRDNERYKELKESKINKYNNDLDDGVITLIKKNWNNCGYIKDFELYFKLISIDQDVLSNSITILIDGADFYTHEDRFDWNQFISKFNGETNFYELNWPNKIIDLKTKTQKKERTLKFIAKTCGKLLGHILYSEKFFPNFQINLVGLNYGCFIIKNCLKLLEKLNSLDTKKIFIKNVIFINGAINIRNKNNWGNIFENLIVDKIINCYSKNDIINKSLENCGLNIQTIGTQGLGINDVGKNYLKYEHDLTDFNFGIIGYDLSIPANISFASYNDL